MFKARINAAIRVVGKVIVASAGHDSTPVVCISATLAIVGLAGNVANINEKSHFV
jgi:hypothetical protein